MKPWSFILVLALAAAPAAAQPGRDGRGPPPGKNQGMTKDERQRMRQDMRDVYRNPGPDRGRGGQRQMSPQQREQLRRDIQDANRDMKR